jgi:hypothetical protein
MQLLQQGVQAFGPMFGRSDKTEDERGLLVWFSQLMYWMAAATGAQNTGVKSRQATSLLPSHSRLQGICCHNLIDGVFSFARRAVLPQTLLLSAHASSLHSCLSSAAILTSCVCPAFACYTLHQHVNVLSTASDICCSSRGPRQLHPQAVSSNSTPAPADLHCHTASGTTLLCSTKWVLNQAP